MARHNNVSLIGAILKEKPPTIVKDDSGNYKVGISFIRVSRGNREVGDGKLIKYDSPVIWTQDPDMIAGMDKWKPYDIVYVKGTIATRAVVKKSHCTSCNTENKAMGVLVYINPIHILKIGECKDEQDCINYLQKNGEVSNQVQIIGTLIRDPKKITPKAGLIVTQYPVALKRKLFVKMDDPATKADYPWIKSYGENAVNDRLHLRKGAEVYIDGCIQARHVNRHAVCAECGKNYDWTDNAMEIVPFSTEYLTGQYTEQEIEENEKRRIAQAKRDIFGKRGFEQQLPDDELTQDDYSAGIDPDAD